jgi:hypothetical protein
MRYCQWVCEVEAVQHPEEGAGAQDLLLLYWWMVLVEVEGEHHQGVAAETNPRELFVLRAY